MGIFQTIRDAVETVADAVETAVNKAADAVADVVESVGNLIGDGLSWLGERIPVVGGVLGWLGDVIASAFDLVATAVKAAGAIVGGVVSGLIKLVGGILTLDPDLILGGLGDLAGGISGGIVAVLAKVAALVQSIVTVGRPRRLNALERRLVERVFRDSIATYNVRVVDGNAGLFSVNDRPFVVGNVIYMMGLAAASEPEGFIHECVHVWQNQHAGSAYIGEALGSQWFGVGYDWESEADAGKDWMEFEREAQGEFIEDVYDEAGTTADPSAGGGAFFDEDDESLRAYVVSTDDYTALANAATRTIRGAVPWRLSEIGGG